MEAKEIKIMYKAWFHEETTDKWISEIEPYERWLERKLYEAQNKSQKSDSLPCVSESKSFDIHNCINEILKDVDRYRYAAMIFVKDGRIRYQVKRAIDKMLYSR